MVMFIQLPSDAVTATFMINSLVVLSFFLVVGIWFAKGKKFDTRVVQIITCGVFVFGIVCCSVLIGLLPGTKPDPIFTSLLFTALGLHAVGLLVWLKQIYVKPDAHQLKTEKEVPNSEKEQTLDMVLLSHELRTPLNAVVGMSNFLLDDNPSSHQLDNLNTLKFCSEKLSNILDQASEISHVEEGSIVFNLREFDPERLLRNIQSTFDSQVKSKGLYFKITMDSSIPLLIKGDPDRLYQVLSNLVSNAIKFTKIGGITISSQLVESQGNDVYIRFCVIDTGCGIALSQQPKIFEKYFRTESAKRQNIPGSGLGLTICKQLLQLQGAKLTCKSQLRRGTTMEFVQKFGNVKNLSIIPNNEDNTSKLIGRKILVVEDNEFNQKVLLNYLNQWMCITDVCNNGEKAVQLHETSKYDLILMDLQMPGMDGFQTAKSIRTSQHNNLVPIMALTAYTQANIRKRSAQNGINDYLIKPFEPKELQKKITQLLPKLHPDGLEPLEGPDLNDESVRKELLNSFFKELELFETRYIQALQQNDLSKLKRAKHKIIPSLKLLGQQNLLQILNEEEQFFSKSKCDPELQMYLTRITNACADAKSNLEFNI